jgi:hypothetical protein
MFEVSRFPDSVPVAPIPVVSVWIVSVSEASVLVVLVSAVWTVSTPVISPVYLPIPQQLIRCSVSAQAERTDQRVFVAKDDGEEFAVSVLIFVRVATFSKLPDYS